MPPAATPKIVNVYHSGGGEPIMEGAATYRSGVMTNPTTPATASSALAHARPR